MIIYSNAAAVHAKIPVPAKLFFHPGIFAQFAGRPKMIFAKNGVAPLRRTGTFQPARCPTPREATIYHVHIAWSNALSMLPFNFSKAASSDLFNRERSTRVPIWNPCQSINA